MSRVDTIMRGIAKLNSEELKAMMVRSFACTEEHLEECLEELGITELNGDLAILIGHLSNCGFTGATLAIHLRNAFKSIFQRARVAEARVAKHEALTDMHNLDEMREQGKDRSLAGKQALINALEFHLTEQVGLVEEAVERNRQLIECEEETKRLCSERIKNLEGHINLLELQGEQ